MIDYRKIDLKYWVLVSLIYFSLIYSTSLSIAYLPESMICDSYLNYNTSHDLTEYYPDLGAYKDVPSLTGTDFWKSSSVWGDCGYYLLQAENVSSSIAPYKYRLLPTSIAALIHKSGLNLPYSFVLMNIIFTYLIAMVFTWFTRREFGFSKDLAMVGGILSVTIVGITNTIPLPMLEPVVYFFFLLVLISLRLNNTLLYVFSTIAAVLSKELLIIIGVLYFANSYFVRKNANLIKVILLSALPFVIFLFIRFFVGGNLIEVNYGYNVLAGEFPLKYVARVLTVPIHLLVIFFLSFSFLWLGLWNIKKDRFLYINTVIAVPLTVIAGIVLSGHIIRIVGIVFPLIIILFLYFFKKDN